MKKNPKPQFNPVFCEITLVGKLGFNTSSYPMSLNQHYPCAHRSTAPRSHLEDAPVRLQVPGDLSFYLKVTQPGLYTLQLAVRR